MKACIARIVVVGSLVLSTACTDAGETTQVGAATGGALGAGLGAIIGHQTGETGGGFVVGGLAGAATGAAIGNAIQAQEEAIQTQDEALERQQQMIRAQAAELSELRRLSQDTVSYGTPGEASALREKRVPVRYLKPPVAAGNSVAPTSTYETPGIEQQAVRQHAPQPVMPTSEQVIARVPQVEDSLPQEGEQIQYGGAPRAAMRYENQQQPDFSGAQAEVAKQGTAGLDQVEPVMRVRTAETNTAECLQADQEMHKADIAQESADKLFHIRRALRLCPDNGGYHGSLGEVYLKLGRREDARFEFEQALKLDPSLHSVRASLSSLSDKNIY